MAEARLNREEAILTATSFAGITWFGGANVERHYRHRNRG
jgi:hypothetical protein